MRDDEEMMPFDGPEFFFNRNGWVGAHDHEMIERMRRQHNGNRDMRRYMDRYMERRGGDSIEHEQRNEEEEKSIEEKDDNIYFEDLLTFPKKLYEKKEDTEDNICLPSVLDFKKEKINKLKEEIFYYCAPPNILNKLSKTIEDENCFKINHPL